MRTKRNFELALAKAPRQREVFGVANAYGLGLKAASELLGRIERCKSEEVAGIFINDARRRAGLDRLKEHDEPIMIARRGALLSFGPETITLTIRKRPGSETAEMLAVRRAGGA